MMPIPNRDAVALSARTTGALFSYAPNSAEIAPLVAAFRTGAGSSSGPSGRSPLASGFAASAEETLPEAAAPVYRAMGPAGAAPGSVWLDKESVLFGDSTLALRQWMRENGIALEADGNEPEDHFGTVLLPAAWLCETEQDALFAQLLAAPAAVVRAFPERLCRPCRPPLLSDAGSAGAGDSGAVAGESADRRGAKPLYR